MRRDQGFAFLHRIALVTVLGFVVWHRAVQLFKGGLLRWLHRLLVFDALYFLVQDVQLSIIELVVQGLHNRLKVQIATVRVCHACSRDDGWHLLTH